MEIYIKIDQNFMGIWEVSYAFCKKINGKMAEKDLKLSNF
jgi:hypothetical protein